MAMCWLLFELIFIQSVVNIDADRIKLSQLEKMVVDLEVRYGILSKKLSEIQFENNYFKENIKELRADNDKFERKFHDLLNENRVQKKINSQLKKEITEIKTLLKSDEFENLFKTKLSLLKSDQSKGAVERDRHLKDDYKSGKTIGANSSKHIINQRGTADSSFVKTPSQRLFLTGIIYF